MFDTVRAAVESTGANCAIIFVPARFAPDAMYEAADAGILLLVAISENIPVQDMMKVRAIPRPAWCAPDRAQLPRAADAGRGKVGSFLAMSRSRATWASSPGRAR